MELKKQYKDYLHGYSHPFENVAVDLVGPLPRTREGYKYILTYICLSSRYPDAKPLKTLMASEVVKAFGHNLCSLLDLLAEELESFTSSNVKVREWVVKLLQRISLVREAMLDVQERTSKKRKEQAKNAKNNVIKHL